MANFAKTVGSIAIQVAYSAGRESIKRLLKDGCTPEDLDCLLRYERDSAVKLIKKEESKSGESWTRLRRFHQLALEYRSTQILDMCALISEHTPKGKVDSGFSISHLIHCLDLKDRTVRDALVIRAITTNMSATAVAQAVRAIRSRSKDNCCGRKPKIPTCPGEALQAFISQSVRWSRWYWAGRDLLPDELHLQASKVNEAMEDALRLAREIVKELEG